MANHVSAVCGNATVVVSQPLCKFFPQLFMKARGSLCCEELLQWTEDNSASIVQHMDSSQYMSDFSVYST